MYTKEAYNSLLISIAQSIDISDEMFEAAEKTYKDLGKWIDQETPDYEISIYPRVRLPLERWFVQLQIQMITIWILSVNSRVSMV